jgi:hypothetical protein
MNATPYDPASRTNGKAPRWTPNINVELKVWISFIIFIMFDILDNKV